MGEEHLKKTFNSRGQVRHRHYVPPNPRHNFKEGEIAEIGRNLVSDHYGLSGTRVKVMARYFIWNWGFKNYGMVLLVLDGPRKGRLYHVPNGLPRKGEFKDASHHE